MSRVRPFGLMQRRVWDYDANGLYCITIATKNRRPLFGNLHDAVMQWSAAGAVADLLWRQLPRWTAGVTLGDFVVMPNHLHGIICVDHPPSAVELHATQLRGFYPKNEEKSHISPSAGSVSSIIRSYKSAVTKQLHQMHLEFEWQRSFHNYPIHTAQDYQRVLQHLQHNRQNWKNDKLYPRISKQKN
jgi:REP element-mobilizing transposase RayT